MPRGSSSGKRQQGSSASHSRHDNGLVAPAKKAQRKKSQGQLVARSRHAESAAAPSRSPLASPSATTPSSDASNPAESTRPTSKARGSVNGLCGYVHATPHGSNGSIGLPNGNGSSNGMARLPSTPDGGGAGGAGGSVGGGSGNGNAMDGRLSRELPHRSSVGAFSVASSADDSLHSSSYHGNAMMEPRQIDVNAAKDAADVHRDSGPLDMAVGVLHALPLHDTLAILLILMHVNPFSLSLIYSIFAWLTFAPPLTSSGSMTVHLAELLDWHATMPSLVTVLIGDVLCLMFWLFLWPAVQQAILDLAKPVIAATLGGGTASRTGRSSRASICFAIMIFHHCWKNSRWRLARLLHLLPPPWRLSLSMSLDPDDPMEMSKSHAATKPGILTTILGIHILTQAIIRYIRELLIRSQRNSSGTQAPGGGDPEAGRPVAASGELTDSSAQVTDGDAAHAIALSSKRRRKQSAQVRLQQPLWAALASTKVVMVKEYELSHATSESAGTNATDIHNLGNAPFDREARKIWISYIGCDEVSFDTSPFPDDYPEAQHPPGVGEDSEPSTPASVATDRTKPFYVRVNKAYWPSTRIVPAVDQGEPEDFEDQLLADLRRPEGTKWTGDIHGLRPMSKYACEFVDSRTDQVLYSVTVTTTREPTRSAAAANGLANGQRRPHSPVTTLKTSIKAAEAKLTEERTKLKTLRKEWKSKIDGLKKENKAADNAINSAGGTDDRHRQKIRQQETQKAQVAQELAEVEAELEAFDPSPDGLQERRKRAEKKHASEKALYEQAQRDFKKYSASVNQAIKEREAERQHLQTRRNKIANRIAKVDVEQANILDANKRGLNEVERRKKERETWQNNVAMAERHLTNQINSLQASNTLLEDHLASAYEQLNLLKAQAAAAAGVGPGFAPLPPPPSHLPQQGFDAVPEHTQAHASSSSFPFQAQPSNPWGSATKLPGGGSYMPQANLIAKSDTMMMSTPWAPATTAAPSAFGLATHPFHSRGRDRSSSLLSDSSSFAQSSSPDDESLPQQPQQQVSSIYRQGGLGMASPGPKTSLPFARARKPSVGEASGRSSRSGGSGSARDPTSPV